MNWITVIHYLILKFRKYMHIEFKIELMQGYRLVSPCPRNQGYKRQHHQWDRYRHITPPIEVQPYYVQSRMYDQFQH